MKQNTHKIESIPCNSQEMRDFIPVREKKRDLNIVAVSAQFTNLIQNANLGWRKWIPFSLVAPGQSHFVHLHVSWGRGPIRLCDKVHMWPQLRQWKVSLDSINRQFIAEYQKAKDCLTKQNVLSNHNLAHVTYFALWRKEIVFSTKLA